MREEFAKIKKLATDIMNNNVQGNYSVVDANETLRKEILEVLGGEFTLNNFRKNKYDMYEIMEETLSVTLPATIEGAFDGMTERKNGKWGDKPEFDVPNKDLFEVANVAMSNMDIKRQRIYKGKLPVETDMYAIKFYAYLKEFLAGRIDWAELVERAQKSMTNKISKSIYAAIKDSYTSLDARLKKTAPTVDEDELAKLIANVENDTDSKALIVGTKSALGRVKSAVLSDNMKDAYNNQGFYGKFRGTLMKEIETKSNEDGVSDFLLIIPDGEKFVKLFFEGEALMDDNLDGGLLNRNDGQIEFFLGMNIGVAVLIAKNYAMWIIQ